MILTILIFFLIIIWLGLGIKYGLGLKFDNFFEEIVLILGIGLGTFPILGVTLNIINIPLHWGIFLAISAIGIIIWFLKIKKIRFNVEDLDIRDNWRFAIILVMFLIYFWVMLSGSFAYPYLEDDDPWSHAMSAKYVAVEMTTDEPSTYDFHYLDPYPPSYSIMMGILNQTNNSIYTTLKLVNAILIALGLLFFFFFAKHFLKDETKALFATFILFILPSFMSHFIWSQTLALILFFPAWYCIEKAGRLDIKSFAKPDKLLNKWNITAGIIIASILVTQPSSAFVFMVMTAIMFIVRALNKDYNIAVPVILGSIIAGAIYWIPMMIRYGLRDMLVKVGLMQDYLTGANVDTSGGVIYSLMDFINAPSASRIDQATGWGWVISLLLLFGIVMVLLNYKKLKSKDHILVALIWMVFTILGTESNALPVKLLPHRFWVFMAIPVAILVAEGMKIILNSFKDKTTKYVVVGVIIAAIVLTSGVPKYLMQTSPTWTAGADVSRDEAIGLSWLQNDKGAKTFMMVDWHDGHAIGNDAFSCMWCTDVVEFRRGIWNKTLDEINAFLDENDYKYLAFGSFTMRNYATRYGADAMQEWIDAFIADLQNSTYFTVAYQNESVIILENSKFE
ncbi:hypothetical protein H6503_00955 [Candidatus Woesearchaeota archaeon]|nr:hypothetical protein [Candidatus Woesearchaeota archaeon]